MNKIKNKFYNNILAEKKDSFNLSLLILIAFLPASLLMPSAFLNLWQLAICIIFIIKIFLKQEFIFFKNNFFYILLFFWSSLILNLFFTSNLENSIIRVLGFGRFIIFIFAIKYYLTLKNSKYENSIYSIWFIIFVLVTFDLIFESIFGFNTLGFVSPWDRRLSGFLNQELKIGNYYYAFILLAISYFINLNKDKFSSNIFFVLSIFIIVSFLIGERSNFIRAAFISVVFFIIVFNKNIIKKTMIIALCISAILFVILKSDKIKERYVNDIIVPINSLSIVEFIKDTTYGAHYDTAINIFKRYPFFGVGLRNFRNESGKDIYINELKFNDVRQSTHPHQVHFEFISETGIFGYISFLIFVFFSLYLSIKNYLKNKNLYLLSSILFFIASIIPLLPSGSFFTPYTAGLFWINYGVMISYEKGLKKI